MPLKRIIDADYIKYKKWLLTLECGHQVTRQLSWSNMSEKDVIIREHKARCPRCTNKKDSVQDVTRGKKIWSKFRRDDNTIDLYNAFVHFHGVNKDAALFLHNLEAKQRINSRQAAAIALETAAYLFGAYL